MYGAGLCNVRPPESFPNAYGNEQERLSQGTAVIKICGALEQSRNKHTQKKGKKKNLPAQHSAETTTRVRNFLTSPTSAADVTSASVTFPRRISDQKKKKEEKAQARRYIRNTPEHITSQMSTHCTTLPIASLHGMRRTPPFHEKEKGKKKKNRKKTKA